MEVVLGMTAVILIVAVGAVVVQGLGFWRRRRNHLQVITKAPGARSVDMENPEPGIEHPLPKQPMSRRGSLYCTTQKWPGYEDHRWTAPVDCQSIPISRIYSSMPSSGIPQDMYERVQTPATAITHLPSAPPPQHQPPSDAR